VALAVTLSASTARAALRLKWDCYLPNASVDCAILQNSLTSKIPFLTVATGPEEADVVVAVTSVPAENATRFLLDLVGRRVDGYRVEVHSTDKIPSSIDSATATVRILTKLERGLDDFMDQKLAAEERNGVLDIQVVDPVTAPFAGRPEQSGVRWYVAPGIGTYFSDVLGVGVNASGNASLSFNDSEPRWRIQQAIGANYNRQSQPVAGTNETASIEFEGANATNVLSWAVSDDGKWNLGLLLAGEKNPQANYTFRANGSVGMEFDLVPMQTVNQKNFGFRCAGGPELERYDAVNVEGLNRQLVGRQFCDLFLGWHFEAIDVWATLGETSVLKDFAYRSFSGGLAANWRLTDNLIVNPWVNLQQINEAINQAQPSNVTYTDPKAEVEASMLAAVQQGYTAPFGVQGGLSVKFVFGNGSLAIEDQRWKAASNLR
jgi:hypothetical protein